MLDYKIRQATHELESFDIYDHISENAANIRLSVE